MNLAKDAKLSGADLAKAIADGYDEVNISGVSYSVTVDGSKLVFEMTDDALEASTATGSFTGNYDVDVFSTAPSDQAGGTVNLATQVITPGNAKIDNVLANTVTKDAIDEANVADGKTITIGDTTYVFASKKETLEQLQAASKAGEKFVAVDISDLVDEDGALDDAKAVATGDALGEALDRLTVAAKDNAMFTVGQTDDNKLTFQEKSTYDGDADLTTQAGVQKQIQMGGTFKASEVKPAKGDGKGLTLQIGDTADSYNQLNVSLGDMHCSSLKDAAGTTLASISIADQASAAKAVDVIKAAINQVSDVRGTLGATQNRLDHTINNLSVMTENIQDAESTIRDTDVAEEMMAYTKNNILIQSAQAMLAQANQVPQGVLQLLQ